MSLLFRPSIRFSLYYPFNQASCMRPEMVGGLVPALSNTKVEDKFTILIKRIQESHFS